MKDLNHDELDQLAEEVPNGPSTQALIGIAGKLNMAILAGLVEKSDQKLYNTYVCVNSKGLVARYRKLHPFINKYLAAGDEYCVFDLLGWKCGILICYDNNVIENVRATSLSGAELIFAPHVTCCTPSPAPGRGYVEDRFWENRATDPESLRKEFDGPKGSSWLMKWLPTRAYDNGVFYAYTNPIGYDGKHLKNGNSMIIDPFGDVLSEIRSFENDITLASLHKEKIQLSGGWRYKNARRPDLYKNIIGKPNTPETIPVWMKGK